MKIPNGPFMPRIRGKVGEAFDSNTDEKLGYTWMIFVTMTLGEGEGDRIQCPNVFATEEEAHTDLNAAVKRALEAINESVTGKKSSLCFDLKNNQLRTWK